MRCLHLKLSGIYLRANVGLLSDDTEVTYKYMHIYTCKTEKKTHTEKRKSYVNANQDVTHSFRHKYSTLQVCEQC